MKSFVSQVAYPALSNAIDIKDEPERGRFGVSKITGQVLQITLYISITINCPIMYVRYSNINIGCKSGHRYWRGSDC